VPPLRAGHDRGLRGATVGGRDEGSGVRDRDPGRCPRAAATKRQEAPKREPIALLGVSTQLMLIPLSQQPTRCSVKRRQSAKRRPLGS
jgi:hypothetical protein